MTKKWRKNTINKRKKNITYNNGKPRKRCYYYHYNITKLNKNTMHNTPTLLYTNNKH